MAGVQMKKLPPGVYNAIMTGARKVRGKDQLHLTLKLQDAPVSLPSWKPDPLRFPRMHHTLPLKSGCSAQVEKGKMIVRLILVDPNPAAGRSDLLVYQVPENSREMALLQELAEKAGIEHVVIGGALDRRAEDEMALTQLAGDAQRLKEKLAFESDTTHRKKLRAQLNSVRAKISRIKKRLP